MMLLKDETKLIFSRRFMMLMLAIQSLSYGFSGLRKGTGIGDLFCFLFNGPESFAFVLDESVSALLLIAGWSLFFCLSQSALLFLSFFIFLTIVTETYGGWSFSGGQIVLQLLSESLCYGLPFCLAFLVFRNKGKISCRWRDSLDSLGRLTTLLLFMSIAGQSLRMLTFPPLLLDAAIALAAYGSFVLSEAEARILLTVFSVSGMLLGGQLFFARQGSKHQLCLLMLWLGGAALVPLLILEGPARVEQSARALIPLAAPVLLWAHGTLQSDPGFRTVDLPADQMESAPSI
ncbi:MAG: hypothetical protein H6618_10370 [Deltaproteobacteria bacterium]|nr:hypothetical protein [Deltaproteobacteria bacterium]